MTATPPLTKGIIGDTTLWRMVMRIDAGRLSVLFIGPESVERSVIFHSETLPDSSSKSLENAVYDNPPLLDDFAAIDIIFSTPCCCLAPTGFDELHEPMANAMLPDYSRPRRIVSDTFGSGEVLYAIDADLFNFVTRTFATARIRHSLAINATYLTHRNRAESMGAKTFVLCEAPGEMSVIAFNNHGNISLLNRPQPSEPADYAYFALIGASADTPLMVGGAPALRNEVCDILRRMQPDARVLPLTLDEDLLRLRRHAPEAPFDMLFLTKL